MAMTKQELDSLLLKKYMDFGIPQETAEKMLKDDRNPSALATKDTQESSHVINPSGNFELKDKPSTRAQSIANAAAINRGKKEDILNLLNNKNDIEVLMVLGAGNIDDYVPSITQLLQKK